MVNLLLYFWKRKTLPSFEGYIDTLNIKLKIELWLKLSISVN